MAISAATDEEITAVRDECIATEKLVQLLHQGSLNQAELDSGLETDIDAAITALKTAVDAVDAAV